MCQKDASAILVYGWVDREFLSHLRLAYVRRMGYFSVNGVGVVNVCIVFVFSSVLCKALTGKTQHSTEFLFRP